MNKQDIIFLLTFCALVIAVVLMSICTTSCSRRIVEVPHVIVDWQRESLTATRPSRYIETKKTKKNNKKEIMKKNINAKEIEINRGQIYGLPKNPRLIRDERFEALKKSIQDAPEMLDLRELIVYPHEGKYIIIGGNMRFRACQDLGYTEIPCKVLPEETPVAKLREYVIKDNEAFGQNDWGLLSEDWDKEELVDWGMETPIEWGEETSGDSDVQEKKQSLSDTFVVPPFSILDTRQGYWQARKKMWRQNIGDIGLSRDGVMPYSLEMQYPNLYSKTREHRKALGISFREYLDKYVSEEEKQRERQSITSVTVSIFDPVLAEVLCKWFTPEKGASIFDCFAGDTQKGLVFGMCGYRFKGIELRQEQVDINKEVLAGRNLPVEYICDDGQNVAKYFEQESQDLLFSCPPYFDLEKYSDLPNDASNQGTYEDFISILDTAFKSAYSCLKLNRFAVIVLGDVRNKKNGAYYDLCGDVKRIFRECGAYLYNELILVETISSGSLRAKKFMESRKVAKKHQNILVFFKGDPKQIRNEFPVMEMNADEEQKLKEILESYTEDENE